MTSRPAARALAMCLVAALATAAAAASAGAQALPGSHAFGFDAGEPGQRLFHRAPLHTSEPYVVIHLAENRLYLMQGARAVWSTPVATGNGFRLEGGDQEWHFQTPRGIFRVQRKEKDPIWIRPDWAFIEAGEPIPPLNSPLRRQKGMLGDTAIYIGYELAIHGTSRPELVLRPNPEDRRVSHGCIRLTNEDAGRLYELVRVGTPVLIY